MTIENAKTFIVRVTHDSALRNALNSTDSTEQVYTILGNEGFSFSAHDFAEAHSHFLANSATPEITENLRLLEKWWEFLTAI